MRSPGAHAVLILDAPGGIKPGGRLNLRKYHPGALPPYAGTHPPKTSGNSFAKNLLSNQGSMMPRGIHEPGGCCKEILAKNCQTFSVD